MFLQIFDSIVNLQKIVLSVTSRTLDKKLFGYKGFGAGFTLEQLGATVCVKLDDVTRVNRLK